jgi:hypothetical protein
MIDTGDKRSIIPFSYLCCLFLFLNSFSARKVSFSAEGIDVAAESIGELNK